MIFVNAAVYGMKKITLYKVNKAVDSHTGRASFIPNRFQDIIYEKNHIKETVQGIPLMEIIGNSKYKKVDLLQIDTEGFYADVISMFYFEKYHPFLVQYEHVHLTVEDRDNVRNRISKYGYLLIEKKNDTFAIRRDQITLGFILIYFLWRIYQSLSSRIKNILI